MSDGMKLYYDEMRLFRVETLEDVEHFLYADWIHRDGKHVLFGVCNNVRMLEYRDIRSIMEVVMMR